MSTLLLFFTINGFKSYHRLFFTLSSIRGFWFSSEFVFLAFSQFEISILKRVCHEFRRAMAAENPPVQTKAR